MRLFRSVFLLLLMLLPSLAAAQSIPDVSQLPTGKRPDSWHIFNGFALGLNPVVFGDQVKAFYKMPWGEGKSLLTADSHWRVGTNSTFSPSYIRPGVMIGVSPLLIMDLDLTYGPGINFMHYAYDSYDDHMDPVVLGEMEDYIGIFHQYSANMTLKAGAGPIAVLHFSDYEYFTSEEYYFNWENGCIFKTGYLMRHKLFLLWEFDKNWRMFTNWEWMHYFTTDKQFQLLSCGLLITNELPYGMSLLFQNGYHLQNEHFTGLKFWMATFREWDFPVK